MTTRIVTVILIAIWYNIAKAVIIVIAIIVIAAMVKVTVVVLVTVIAKHAE